MGWTEVRLTGNGLTICTYPCLPTDGRSCQLMARYMKLNRKAGVEKATRANTSSWSRKPVAFEALYFTQLKHTSTHVCAGSGRPSCSPSPSSLELASRPALAAILSRGQ